MADIEHSKILIAILYDDKKSYCIHQFIDKLIEILKTTKYPYLLYIIDSSPKPVEMPFILTRLHHNNISYEYRNVARDKKELSKQIITRSQNIARDRILKDDGEYFTHLLFWECDVFPDEKIDNKNPIDLLIEQDKDIIGYPTPYYDSLTIFEEVNDIPEYSVRAYPNQEDVKKKILEIYPSKVFKCKGIGFGFTLIKKPVLFDISFRYNKINTYHSDVYFSIDANKKGFQIWGYFNILRHDHTRVIDIA